MSGRRFTDAQELLHALLDSHEKGAERPFAYVDRPSFHRVVDADRFDRIVLACESAGLVSVGYGTGDRRREVQRVRLLDPPGLYRHLERAAVAAEVAEARSIALRGIDLDAPILERAEQAFSAWNRRSTWCNLGPGDSVELRTALVLAKSISRGLHVGLDYRTFSRRTVKDSKALERLETAVLRLVSGSVDLPSGVGPRAAMAAIGLERIGQPMLISGPIALGPNGPEIEIAYIGFAPADAHQVRLLRRPQYVLTVENMVSFHRHVAEADQGRLGLTIYVGGYPSLGVQKALALLATVVPQDVPFFHWSDIDLDGLMILRTVERACGRECRPHLMSVDLAERYGTSARSSPRSRARTDAECGREIAGLEAYLRDPDAKFLEQEELDPGIPWEALPTGDPSI